MNQKSPIVLESFKYEKNFNPFKAEEIFALYLMQYDELDIESATKIAEESVLGGLKVTPEKYIIKIDGEIEDIFYFFTIKNNLFNLGEVLSSEPIIFKNGKYINMHNNKEMHNYIYDFFEGKHSTFKLDKAFQSPLSKPLEKSQVKTRKQLLANLRKSVEDSIESLYHDEFYYCPNSGVWEITTYGFSIYATPFYEDVQGIFIDIVEHDTEKSVYSEVISFTLSNNEFLNTELYLSIIKSAYKLAYEKID